MSFFRYPGGKAKLRKQIITKLQSLIPHNDIQYREPFFGGGSIGNLLMSGNPQLKNLWINDLDVGIACLWTSVIRHPEQLKQKVMDFTPSVEHFYAIKKELLDLRQIPTVEDDLIDVGFKKIAIHQISYSGLGTKSGGPLGGVNQRSIYTVDCRWSPRYICGKIDKLSKYLNTLNVRDNACTGHDFTTLITDDSHPSILYLDPPYYVKGNDLYQHGFTQADHERLAAVLQQSPHPWLLSYDDCPEIRSLYEWATIESLDVNYSITATKDQQTKMRASRRKSEVLITGGKGSC